MAIRLYARIHVWVLVACMLLALGWFPGRAKAQDAFVYYSVSSPAPALFDYELTFVNNLDPLSFTGFDLYDLTLTFPGTPTVTVTDRPLGWTEIANEGTIEFVSFLAGVPPGGSDIPPGTGLAGFKLSADRSLEGTTFTALFTNPDDPTNPRSFEGVIRPQISGSLAPEPSSGNLVMPLCLIAGTCVGMLQGRRMHCRQKQHSTLWESVL